MFVKLEDIIEKRRYSHMYEFMYKISINQNQIFEYNGKMEIYCLNFYKVNNYFRINMLYILAFLPNLKNNFILIILIIIIIFFEIYSRRWNPVYGLTETA